MIATSGHKIALIEARRGMLIRTAGSLEEMLEEICTNSGEVIAFKSEEIAKRAADKWRKIKEQEGRENVGLLSGLVDGVDDHER